MSTAGAVRALPPPRRISHAINFLWWIAVLLLAAIGYFAERRIVSDDNRVLPTGNEREAFLVVEFGKIAEQGTDVILAQNFREQLNALRSAGYTAIGLDSVEAFFNEGRPLPDRPVLLVFDNVQRDSIEIVDQALAAADWRGVAFADVDALAAGNIDLVSRHRLDQMADSGRWDIGVSACPRVSTPEQPVTPQQTVEDFRRGRTLVEQWTDQPVRVIDCERGLEKSDAGESWRDAITQAGYRFGIVVSNPKANFIDDSPLELGRVRVFREWSATDLLSSLEARKPRRGGFVDDFDGSTPKTDWAPDRADLAIENGTLKVTARAGANGGLLLLGGTDRWSDADVKVTVADVPDGQFWISLRSSPFAYVRVGISHGQAVFQKSEKGENHQYGSRGLPGKRFVLGLRVLGGKASATVNGEELSDRPIEMPSAPVRGPLALAVWDADGKASVRLQRVEATPLRVRSAIVAASPGEGAWDELRRQRDEFAVLSPRYFSWKHGRSSESGAEEGGALSIFARHHRLRLLPAVDVEVHDQGADFGALGEQLLRWARHPGFDGLNVLVGSQVASSRRWRQLIGDLRSKLKKDGRSLAVTVTDQKGELPGGLREFGNIYAMERPGGGGLEIAVAPISLVGTPAG